MATTEADQKIFTEEQRRRDFEMNAGFDEADLQMMSKQEILRSLVTDEAFAEDLMLRIKEAVNDARQSADDIEQLRKKTAKVHGMIRELLGRKPAEDRGTD